jgi:alkyl hydroperoxide reductase subunit AhpC
MLKPGDIAPPFDLPCASVGRSVSETLRIVRALRIGQLCPADWTPGVTPGPTDRKF